MTISLLFPISPYSIKNANVIPSYNIGLIAISGLFFIQKSEPFVFRVYRKIKT